MNLFGNPGLVTAEKIVVSKTNATKLMRRFIAFDTETTGLSCDKDSIIELGAVLFENGVQVKSFNTLIHAVDHVPSGAAQVNHITDYMVLNAPEEDEAYEMFLEFIGEGLEGKIPFVAHNAPFDFRFLTRTLTRLGYQGNLKYADTLMLSRKLLPNLYSHSQNCVANYFGYVNEKAHRATSDAEICGKIFIELAKMMKE